MMKRFLFLLAALAACAAAAAAQFSQFTWTLTSTGPFITGLDADTMLIGSSASAGSGDFAHYSTVSPVDAFVTVHATTIATPKGNCGDSNGIYGFGEGLLTISDCSSVDLAFSVHASDTILFGLEVNGGPLPGDAWFGQFSFKPYWTPLGGALAGSAGLPSLVGSGVLEPGELVRLITSNAAPSAPAALVIGFNELSLPFKGGVMVPSLDVVIAGLSTNAAGFLNVGSTWPAGLSSGFRFLAQTWIVDAGGPQGYAASNAVKAIQH